METQRSDCQPLCDLLWQAGINISQTGPFSKRGPEGGLQVSLDSLFRKYYADLAACWAAQGPNLEALEVIGPA